MGFGREAARVRDTSLPVRYRLHALGSCIQLAQPLGFTATWSYLQDRTGFRWRDPQILEPAIWLLEAEREAFLRADARYSDVRRAQKAAGLRVPPRDVVTPTAPRRWHGDEQLGARHVLARWHRRSHALTIAADPLGGRVVGVAALRNHPRGRVVLDAVDRALTDGTPALDAPELQPILDWARAQLREGEHDRREHRIALEAHLLLAQLHLLVHGATPVATRWTFSST